MRSFEKKSIIVALVVSTLLFVSRSSHTFKQEENIQLVVREFPPVIMYHDIKEIPLNKFDVTASNFEKQLIWIRDNGYKTISLDDLYKGVVLKKGLPKKSIVLTFDDGYLGNYTIAYQVLRRFGMKANFFIHIEGIARDIPGYKKLSWEHIKIVDKDPLFKIYSHTISHSDLTKLNHEQLVRELVESRNLLESKLGGKRRYIAYPYGNYNHQVILETKKAGYKMAFSVSELEFFDGTIQYTIPRISMGTIMNNIDFFSFCIQNYKQMPKVCFEERWEPIKDSQ